MKLVIWIMLVSGICVALGLLYRLSSLIYFVLFTYIFTLEEGVRRIAIACVQSHLARSHGRWYGRSISTTTISSAS